METEIIQVVMTEMLEELKGVAKQQQEQTKALSELTEQVKIFEQKLSGIKVSAPAVDLNL